MHPRAIPLPCPYSRLTLLVPAVLAALLGSIPAPSSAAPLPADSRISAVTVYTDRAVVTRTAPLELATTGIFEVNFEKLPRTTAS